MVGSIFDVYVVTLHDDADWQGTVHVLASSKREAEQNPSVLSACEREDAHVIGVRLCTNPSHEAKG